MDPVLTLPFSENMVINQLEKKFNKRDGYSILIPSTRQQKGFDLLIYNNKTKKCLTIQVKGSRTYNPSPPKNKGIVKYKNYTWFSKFKIEKGLADFYVLFGLFITNPTSNERSKSVKKTDWYDHIMLIFTEQEMIKFLGGLRLKTMDKEDTKFSFGFNDKKRVVLTRGTREHVDHSDKLFPKRVHALKTKLF
jgi:hypothetical protein